MAILTENTLNSLHSIFLTLFCTISTCQPFELSHLTYFNRWQRESCGYFLYEFPAHSNLNATAFIPVNRQYARERRRSLSRLVASRCQCSRCVERDWILLSFSPSLSPSPSLSLAVVCSIFKAVISAADPQTPAAKLLARNNVHLKSPSGLYLASFWTESLGRCSLCSIQVRCVQFNFIL